LAAILVLGRRLVVLLLRVALQLLLLLLLWWRLWLLLLLLLRLLLLLGLRLRWLLPLSNVTILLIRHLHRYHHWLKVCLSITALRGDRIPTRTILPGTLRRLTLV
jgi:hypothetical protein